jgi:hypothetical protein
MATQLAVLSELKATQGEVGKIVHALKQTETQQEILRVRF